MKKLIVGIVIVLVGIVALNVKPRKTNLELWRAGELKDTGGSTKPEDTSTCAYRAKLLQREMDRFDASRKSTSAATRLARAVADYNQRCR